MKTLILLCLAAFLLSSCGPSKEEVAATARHNARVQKAQATEAQKKAEQAPYGADHPQEAKADDSMTQALLWARQVTKLQNDLARLDSRTRDGERESDKFFLRLKIKEAQREAQGYREASINLSKEISQNKKAEPSEAFKATEARFTNR